MLVSPLFISSALTSTGRQAVADRVAGRRALGGGLGSAMALAAPVPPHRRPSARRPRCRRTVLARTGAGNRGHRRAGSADLRLDQRRVLVLRAARRTADHRACQRNADGRVEPHHGVRQAAPQAVGNGLADHVAGDRDRAIAAVAAFERVARRDQADDADQPAGVADVLDLEREVAVTAIDQHDLAGERTRRGNAAQPSRLPPAPLPYCSGCLDRRPSAAPTTAGRPPGSCPRSPRRDDLHQRQESARHGGLRDRQRRLRCRRRAIRRTACPSSCRPRRPSGRPTVVALSTATDRSSSNGWP